MSQIDSIAVKYKTKAYTQICMYEYREKSYEIEMV